MTLLLPLAALALWVATTIVLLKLTDHAEAHRLGPGRTTLMTRMSRQELAVRVLLVLDAMPIPERLLHLVCPVWAPIIGVLMITTGTNWLMWVSLLLALVGTVRSVVEIRREVLDDDNFEWEEVHRP